MSRTENSLSINKRKVSADEAKQIGATLGITWAKIDLDQFQAAGEVFGGEALSAVPLK